MENTKKLKKSAFVLLVAVCLVMLYFITISVASIAAHGFMLYPAPAGASLSLAKNALYVVNTLILLSTQICALILLLSIKKDETPFNLRNVRLLKGIAIPLMALEPIEAIAAKIPITLEDNAVVSLTYFPAGSVLVVGIVVYCVSLVFRYGISLQEQSDETL